MNGPADPLDTSRAHSARVYDYLLGGKDNFAADRAAAEALLAVVPSARAAARANRGFMRRAAAMLARRGVRQYLDLGTGLPTSPNLHEIVQAVQPGTRVVYVDNDPLVLAHARALLTSAPGGVTAYIDADVSDVDAVLAHPDLEATLDLTQPVAVFAIALTHFLPGQVPHQMLRRLVGVLPRDSYLAVSAFTTDLYNADEARQAEEAAARMGTGVVARTFEEFARFFDGTRLVDPGIVTAQLWRPDPAEAEDPQLTDTQVSMWAGVGRCE